VRYNWSDRRGVPTIEIDTLEQLLGPADLRSSISFISGERKTGQLIAYVYV
jgi:hypothetical protein